MLRVFDDHRLLRIPCWSCNPPLSGLFLVLLSDLKDEFPDRRRGNSIIGASSDQPIREPEIAIYFQRPLTLVKHRLRGEHEIHIRTPSKLRPSVHSSGPQRAICRIIWTDSARFSNKRSINIYDPISN